MQGIEYDIVDARCFVPGVDSRIALRGCLAKPGLLLRDAETGKFGYDRSAGRQ